MSLYNSLFGVNPFTPILLGVLNTRVEQIPRFRDVFVENDEIIIYTRTGGGNRDEYDRPDCPGPSNADLRNIPGYLRDEDDSFDSTFAYFHYAVPKNVRLMLAQIAKATKDRPTPSDAWKRLKADLDEGRDTPATNRAKDVAEHITAEMKAGKTIIEV